MGRSTGRLFFRGIFPLFVFLVAECAVASPHARELGELAGRVQSMSHGYFAVSEWSRLLGDLDVLSARAERAQDWSGMLETRLLKAVVLDELLNDPGRALAVVQQTRQKLKSVAPMPGYNRLFVKEAQVYARLGDDPAIGRLIEEFRKSPFYDPQPYRFTGGQGREAPLALTRPHARGDDSLTVTAMEVARRRARSAAGGLFPDFELTDIHGRPVRLADYRGRVVLIDFWLPQSVPWQRELPTLTRLYDEYRRHGFEIVGVNIERDPRDLESFLRRSGMTWPQVAGDTTLSRRLGIFGDAGNFLLDQNGRILARDLRGAGLAQAVRAALGVQ